MLSVPCAVTSIECQVSSVKCLGSRVSGLNRSQGGMHDVAVRGSMSSVQGIVSSA